MKINVQHDTTSSKENVKMVGLLIKELCEEFGMKFDHNTYAYFLDQGPGSDFFSEWLTTTKKLPAKFYFFKHDTRALGTVIELEENKVLTELLLKQ